MAMLPQVAHSVKAPVKPAQQRALDLQVQKTIQMRQDLFADVLLPMRVVQHALGDISYAQLNSLIKAGKLKTWRISPHSQKKGTDVGIEGVHRESRERRCSVSRGKPCTICAHGERQAIDAALLTGLKHAAIARQFAGISTSMISRHGRKCLGVSATGTPATELSLEQQVGLWTGRANELYVSSAAALDLRSQGAAIGAAFRAMELSFRQREKTETKEQERMQRADSPEAPLTVSRLDELVRQAEAQARANPVSHLIRKMETELSLLGEHQRGAARAGLRAYLKGETAA